MSAREQLVAAAKTILWQRGYEAMSPRAILAESGAGQGSLYHHFRGKADLAATAVNEVSADLCASAGTTLDHNKPPIDRIIGYLTQPREALRGCRLGRLTAEPVIADEAIREPIAAYFTYVEGQIAAALDEAQHSGMLRDDLPVRELATTLLAVVQGGYVLARAFDDPAQMDRAVHGAVALLNAALRP